jgi:glutamyl-tRNA reductase
MVENFKSIAFTFKYLSSEQIGSLHKPVEEIKSHFTQFLKAFQLEELMYLSTCNRVEFFVVTERELDKEFLHWFIHAVKPNLSKAEIELFISAAEIHEGILAVKHLMRLSASLESMVVGEREIITQVRQAFENSKEAGLVGDTIRLIMRQNIEAAKQVYNDTTIALHPVSVVSLAVRELQDTIQMSQPNILIIGAGQTIQAFTNYLHKSIKANYFVCNRSIEKAKVIAKQLNGQAFSLTALKSFCEPIDIIVSCTGATLEILDAETVALYNKRNDLQLVIDLAIPADINKHAVLQCGTKYIGLDALQIIAKENLSHRQSAISEAEIIIGQNLEIFEALYKERQIEKAFSSIPAQIRQAKEKAINEVFEAEIEKLDDNAKDVLLRALNYLEKKANTAVMTAAKSELL